MAIVQWLPTQEMLADVLTKERKMPSGLESVLWDNILDLPKESINKLQAIEEEIQMYNIRNRKVLFPGEH